MRKYFTFFLLFTVSSVCLAQDQADHILQAKNILELIRKSEFENAAAYFDSLAAKQFTPAKLKERWKAAVSQAGKYVKTMDFNEEHLPNYSIVVLTVAFEKRAMDVRMLFNRKDMVSNFLVSAHRSVEKYRLPGYFDSLKVEEKEVKIISGKNNLPGTFTTPRAQGRFPTILFVHGTGPNDRDESVGATKMFKDIALGLAGKGIASLRYDKRSYVNSKVNVHLSNSPTVREETIEDVVEAVNLLKKNSEVDTNRIFLFGHGLGGMLLPRIAELLPQAGGICLAGANARPLEDLIYGQSVYLLSLDSMTGKKKALLDTLQSQVAEIKKLKNTFRDSTFGLLLYRPRSYWADLGSYNQIETLKRISVPALILQGERDYQTPASEFDLWKNQLEGRSNVQFRTYPRLNHVFQEGKERSRPEEYDKQGNVPAYVIDDISTWILLQK